MVPLSDPELLWGYVLRRFLPTARRLLAALAVGVVAGFAVAATISSPANATDPESPEVYGGQHHGCKQLGEVSYKHEFNVDLERRKATASIETVGKRLCEGLAQNFTLVSYITKSGKFELPQHLFASQTKTVTRTDYEQSFEIDIPACFTQVDFVFGEAIALDVDGKLYGPRKVGSSGAPGNQSHAKRGNPQQAWFNGGKECDGKPQASGQSRCDGSVDVTQQNTPGSFRSTTFTIHRGSASPITETVTPTKPMTTVRVPAGDLSDVVVKVSGDVIRTLPWTRPIDCSPPTITE